MNNSKSLPRRDANAADFKTQTNKKLVELTPPKVIITDDDYASKVDRLVDNMVDSDDNEPTHDSEGC